MLNTLTLILLFVLPFVVFPISPSFFETPKVLLAEVLIELVFLNYFFQSKIKIKLPRPFFWPLGILIILTIIDILFLPTETTFFGNPFRLQGVFLLWHLIVWAIITSQFELKIPKILLYLSLPTLLFASLILGHDTVGRAIGTLGEPNALAASAVFLWPFTSKYGKLKYLGPVIAFLVIFFSNSRSGLIALLIQLIFLLVWKITRKVKVATILGVILILCSFALPFREDVGRFENRAQIWQTSFVSGLESPILGHGFGNIEESLKTTSIRINNNIQYQYIDSAHNIFLDYWVQSGLVGLGALLGLIYFAVGKFIKEGLVKKIVLLLGLITVLSFNPGSVVTLVAFWWVLGRGFNKTSSAL